MRASGSVSGAQAAPKYQVGAAYLVDKVEAVLRGQVAQQVQRSGFGRPDACGSHASSVAISANPLRPPRDAPLACPPRAALVKVGRRVDLAADVVVEPVRRVGVDEAVAYPARRLDTVPFTQRPTPTARPAATSVAYISVSGRTPHGRTGAWADARTFRAPRTRRQRPPQCPHPRRACRAWPRRPRG